jgi:TetR/AcrR family transcriptional regulator, cholesterol catabolism regulator
MADTQAESTMAAKDQVVSTDGQKPTTDRMVANRDARADRRSEILRLATEVFAERGFVGATVRDIAEAAGILSGSLYHHFDSKESMLEEILHGMLDGLVSRYEVVAAKDSDAATALREMFGIGLRAVVEEREGIKILHNDYGYFTQVERFAFVGEQGHRIMDLWVQVIERAVANGEFHTNVDAAVAYRAMMGAIFSAVRWFQADGPMSVDDLADQFTALYIDGLRA